VGLGRGISAVTRPAGVGRVPAEAPGLRVEVRNGIRVEEIGIGLILCGVHELKKRKNEERRILKTKS
jgi:hypothetical protein